MNNILKFKGTWRNYQKRVLSHAEDYIKDGKIHIVAAPGSGKTTLGIELIGRLDKPALILAPSITIREQWIDRIKEGFLVDGINPSDVISNNLKNPKVITVATYQALYSAMTRFSGKIIEKSEETNVEDTSVTQTEEEVDYSDFELIKAMQEIKLGIICLDECHHLRSEWWKALESFRSSFEEAKIIALTATPPYDSTPAMWKRYVDMCGEIDEEITIPELVKEGSLCPHQDYVLFNYPTKEENAEIKKFKQNSESFFKSLMENKSFEVIIASHKGLLGEMEDDLLLDNPSYLSSILIYLQEKKIPYPKRLLELLGVKKLPRMEEKWMEPLLQGLLFDDCESYLCDKVFRESLIKELKSKGLIEKRKVCMVASSLVEKMLVQSKGKIESIKQIVTHEYESMGADLRLLILTDYIRKECESNLGNLQVDIIQMGVLPFFELLRRDAERSKKKQAKLCLGVLCGTMVIIPAEAKEALIKRTGEDKISFFKAGKLSEEEYLVVKAVGRAHFLTTAVTELFEQGYIQVLIGTKSLLGEGWDAPCVNSLILASFVGSFMLSNQMRGRAIRVDQNNPNKTSNIWHLVCINPEKLKDEGDTGINSEDYQMLCRRMDHFLGLHYQDDTIESGVGRLSAIHFPFTKSNIRKTNEEMLTLSEQRNKLRERWQRSLAVINEMEVVDQIDISERFITCGLFFDALAKMGILIAVMLGYILFMVGFELAIVGVAGLVINIGLILAILYFGMKAWLYRSPLKRLEVIGKGIAKAMFHSGMLPNENYKVQTESLGGILYAVYLMGGTGKEKDDFAKCVVQFFSEVDNQRYLLVKCKRSKGMDKFFTVPEAFARKKEDALMFAECMKPFIGAYDLVYTRNPEGRKLLLEARAKAFANREQRCFTRKKVKSGLE